MGNIDNWVRGGLVALLGLLGLFLASYSNETNFYYIGLALAGGAIAFIFLLIKSAYDEADGDKPH